MRTILLAAGAALLNSQYGTPNRIRINSFQCGSRGATLQETILWDEVEPSLASMQGPVVLTGDYTLVTYTITALDEVKLTCWVPESLPEVPIANVVLLGGFNPSDYVPLFFLAAERSTIKLQTTVDSVGYSAHFQFTLTLPGLNQRFTFENLEHRVPEWLQVPTEQELPLPYADGHDQFVVTDHTRYGGVHPVLNAGNQHWGCPLAQPFDPVAPSPYWTISGGVRGDDWHVPE